MLYFKDLHEGGETYLCVTSDSKARAKDAKHKFLVWPSLSRPDSKISASGRKIDPPMEMTTCPDKTCSRPTYILKSTLKTLEEEFGSSRPFIFGREIIHNGVRWGPKVLKFPGEFAYLPSYWEWTEDVIVRCAERLKFAKLYDAVYASLYSYDFDPNVMRAFCESWCPQTNTLHTEVGEWSPSLWDLERLGGLSASGHLYDEAIPDTIALDVRGKHKERLIPRAFERLLEAYCFLEDQNTLGEGVSAAQWIQFWCRRKRDKCYSQPPRKRPRETSTRPKNTHNPSGEISLESPNWTHEEVEVFNHLHITDVSERKTTYLAAYLSCWLCVFALPEHTLRLIRPNTFEIAARMAKGERFSLAPPVLASIYHGLNDLVTSGRPSSSNSIFPAHYLYGWLAYYFRTHHGHPSALLGPLMAQYSGYGGAKIYEAAKARELIHSGVSFKAASLLLARNRCSTVRDDEKLDSLTSSYIISLRTAYLPLRSGAFFFLEPYHPTRFARQFGFYQEVPGVLPRFQKDGTLSLDIALTHLRTLLCKGSQTKVTLPGSLLNWADFVSPEFARWWRAVTVTDLREKVEVLISSVGYRVKKLAIDVPRRDAVVIPTGKRVRDDFGDDDEAADHPACVLNGKRQVYDALFGASSISPERPADALEERVSKVPLPVSAADAPRSSYGSSTSSASFCASGSPVGREEEGATNGATLQLAQSRSIRKEDDFTQSMADLIKDHWLKRLIDTVPEKVDAFVAESGVFFESIKSFGGDISSFRAKVDAYVSCVSALSAARTGGVIDEAPLDRAIIEAGRNLKSVQITLRDVRLAAESHEQRLSSIAEERVKLKALLKTLDEEEMSVVCRHSEQIEEISILESKARALEQQQADLQVSKSKVERLKELERELGVVMAELRASA